MEFSCISSPAPPTITGTSYIFNLTGLELTCTSTGSVATTVTWMKDGSLVVIDGTVFILTQTVTDRAASTYNNVLLVNRTNTDVQGTYVCTVSNEIGSDSADVNVSISKYVKYCSIKSIHA